MQSTIRKKKPPTKWERVLAALARGESFNRFEAERQLADHVLPSTVAELQRKGVPISRRDEQVLGYAGIPTLVSRYWLAPTSIPIAKALLSKTEEFAPASRQRAQELLGDSQGSEVTAAHG